MTRIAILDDYQNAVLEGADWSSLRNRTEVTIFDRLSDRSVAFTVRPSFVSGASVATATGDPHASAETQTDRFYGPA
jgi:hypothetical protein